MLVLFHRLQRMHEVLCTLRVLSYARYRIYDDTLLEFDLRVLLTKLLPSLSADAFGIATKFNHSLNVP